MSAVNQETRNEEIDIDKDNKLLINTGKFFVSSIPYAF